MSGLVQVNDGSRTAQSNGDVRTASGNKNLDAYVQGHGETYVACLFKADLAADEAFVLIDLSDTTNFPHVETGKIRLYTLDVVIEAKTMTSGEGILYIGVITEVDADNGSTEWLWVMPVQTYLEASDDTDRRHYHFAYPWGLDLEVDGANDTLANGVSNSGDSGDTDWQTDTDLDSPAGDTNNSPGDGDLVMLWDETTDGLTVSITVTVEYATEATG